MVSFGPNGDPLRATLLCGNRLANRIRMQHRRALRALVGAVVRERELIGLHRAVLRASTFGSPSAGLGARFGELEAMPLHGPQRLGVAYGLDP